MHIAVFAALSSAMPYVCDVCGHAFTRHYNLIRHKLTMHDKSDFITEDDSASQTGLGNADSQIGSDLTTVRPSLDETKEDIFGKVDENERDSSDEKSDDASDAGEDSDEGSVNEENEFWLNLGEDAYHENSDELNKTIENIQNKEGVGKSEAVTKARRKLFPVMRKYVYKTYYDVVNQMNQLKKDPIHKQILATKRKLVKEDDYGEDEAFKVAIKKRKFLIQEAARVRDEDLAQEDSDKESESEHAPSEVKNEAEASKPGHGIDWSNYYVEQIEMQRKNQPRGVGYQTRRY